MRVRVQDIGEQGPGRRRVGELFEPFFTTKPEDTALGLAISRAIARAHGGDVIYAREETTTTRFELTLPALRTLAAPAPAEEPRGMSTVLIVEDKAGLRQGLCDVAGTCAMGLSPIAAARNQRGTRARWAPSRSTACCWTSACATATAWISCASSGRRTVARSAGDHRHRIRRQRTNDPRDARRRVQTILTKPFDLPLLRTTVLRATKQRALSRAAAPLPAPARSSARRAHWHQRRDARHLEADRARRGVEQRGAHHRRDRHRQGAGRTRDPLVLRARRTSRSCPSTWRRCRRR